MAFNLNGFNFNPRITRLIRSRDWHLGWRKLAPEGTTHIVDMHPVDRMHVNAQPNIYWKLLKRKKMGEI
jgi:hypothetical protein